MDNSSVSADGSMDISFDNNTSITQQNNTTHVFGTISESRSVGYSDVFSGELRIALYSIIFLLSLTGNTLVIVTLVQNRQMRTVLNVFLLNLSISDLLLAVFCMPFTLIPTLLRDFIFGTVMCVLIRYMQGKTMHHISTHYIFR